MGFPVRIHFRYDGLAAQLVSYIPQVKDLGPRKQLGKRLHLQTRCRRPERKQCYRASHRGRLRTLQPSSQRAVPFFRERASICICTSTYTLGLRFPILRPVLHLLLRTLDLLARVYSVRVQWSCSRLYSPPIQLNNYPGSRSYCWN